MCEKHGRVVTMGYTAEELRTIDHALASKCVEELKMLARSCYVQGSAKMRKQELISVVRQALLEPGRMEELIYVMRDKVWRDFQKVCQCGICPPAELDIDSLNGLLDLGYLFPVHEGKRLEMVVMPEEIQAVYQKLCEDGLRERKERYDLLDRYARAASNLYGVLPMEEFIEIFNAQNAQKTDLEEAASALIKHSVVEQLYCIWHGLLVVGDFAEDDFEGVEDLVARTDGKPRYVPAKDELLRYVDWNYYERTPEVLALEDFLAKEANLPILMASQVITDIYFAIASESNMSEIFGILEDHHITLKEDQLQPFMNRYAAMANTTRLWSNKGHTPSELFYGAKPELRRAKKIGRNEPCPCGSGKKYKNCCGRFL